MLQNQFFAGPLGPCTWAPVLGPGPAWYGTGTAGTQHGYGTGTAGPPAQARCTAGVERVRGPNHNFQFLVTGVPCAAIYIYIYIYICRERDIYVFWCFLLLVFVIYVVRSPLPLPLCVLLLSCGMCLFGDLLFFFFFFFLLFFFVVFFFFLGECGYTSLNTSPTLHKCCTVHPSFVQARRNFPRHFTTQLN